MNPRRRPRPASQPPDRTSTAARTVALRLAVPIVFVVACASSAVTTPDASSPDDVSPDGTSPDSTGCPPRYELPGAPACTGLLELTAAANAVAGSPDTFALTNLSPTRNDLRPTCIEAPSQDGFESRLRFTAPRGGRWRFTASGDALWAVDVRLHCGAPTACEGRTKTTHPDGSPPYEIDVQLERGESVSLALDGCPRAGACRYALRAQRITDLACEFTTTAQRRCTAEGERCTIDDCDPERFRCVAASP